MRPLTLTTPCPAAYASLAPPKYIVKLAFPALMPPNPALCNSSAPGSSCLPLVSLHPRLSCVRAQPVSA